MYICKLFGKLGMISHIIDNYDMCLASQLFYFHGIMTSK
jgi:hypothetical protein